MVFGSACAFLVGGANNRGTVWEIAVSRLKLLRNGALARYRGKKKTPQSS